MFRDINHLSLDADQNTKKKKSFFKRLNELDNLTTDKIDLFNKEKIAPFLDSMVEVSENLYKEAEKDLKLHPYRRVNKIMKEKNMNLKEAIQYYNKIFVPGINEL